jgi:hypothetical protein
LWVYPTHSPSPLFTRVPFSRKLAKQQKKLAEKREKQFADADDAAAEGAAVYDTADLAGLQVTARLKSQFSRLRTQ